MGLISSLEERQDHGPLSDYWYNPMSGPTASGVEVTPRTAISAAGVWNAVWSISMTLGTLPLRVYRRRADGRGRDAVPDHPLYRPLYRRPNRWMPAYRYRSTLQAHLLLYGNAYSQILRDRLGRVRELVPLHPSRVQVKMKRVVGDRGKESWVRVYTYYQYDGTPRPFDEAEVFHMTGLSPGGLLGWNPMDVMRETFATTLAVEEHSASYYRNKAVVGGVLTSPKKLDDEPKKKLAQQWLQAYSRRKAFGTALLEDGVEYKEFGRASARDAELVANRTHQVQETARAFNVPPVILKELSRATYSNIEQQSLDYVIHAIRPWAEVWEQSIEMDLLDEDEQGEYFAKHSLDALLRGDTESRTAHYREMWGIGAFSINDILEKEDMNPVEGGDRRFVPFNMQPLDQVDERPLPGEGPDEEEDPDEDPEDDEPTRAVRSLAGDPEFRARQVRSVAARQRHREAFRGIFKRASDKIVKRETRAARRALAGASSRRDLEGFVGWMERFYAELPTEIIRVFQPVLFAYAAEVQAEIADELGSDEDYAEQLNRFLTEYVSRYALRYSRKSLAQFRRALETDDPTAAEAALERVIDRWEKTRAEVESNRESVRSDNAIAVAIYSIARILAKWFTVGKSCPGCQSMDGKTVSAGSAFLTKGDLVPMGDDQPDLSVTGSLRHPPLHGGCDCMVIAA